MKRRLAQILRALAFLTMIGGIVAAGFTYRDMKMENLMHARTAVIPVSLDSSSEWKTEQFLLYRPGKHIVYLTTVNSFSRGYSDTVLTDSVYFSGSLDITISSPGGGLVLNRHYSGDALDLLKPENMAWTPLDSLEIADPGTSAWTIRARITEGDPRFARMTSEVLILPPQKYDIGWYMYGQTFTLIARGSLILLGFILLVAASAWRRRIERQQAS